MFEAEQKTVENKILSYCLEKQYPVPEFRWTWIPFSGQWGISTSFFQLAAKSFGDEKGNVAERAQKIASELAQWHRDKLKGFSKIEAINGYLESDSFHVKIICSGSLILC